MADVVIIGGGIAGLSLAAELGKASLRVVVLEQNRFGSGATGKGFSWVNCSSKISDEVYHHLNAIGLRHYAELNSEFREERLGWHGGGSLYWAEESDATGHAKLLQRYETLQNWKRPALLLNAEEMETLEPAIAFSAMSKGLFLPDEGWVDASRLVRFFIELGNSYKVERREFCPVTALNTDRFGMASSVETESETFATRRVVLCAGVRNQALLKMASESLEMNRIPNILRESPGLLVETDSLPTSQRIERVIYPPSSRGFHLRPAASGGILLGADDTDENASNNAIAELLERARRLFRDPVHSISHSHRVCVRPMPADSFPIVGEFTSLPGFFILAMHSGITLAPTLARILATEIATGELSPLLQPYRPDRFFNAL